MLRTGQSPAPSQGRSSSASTPGSHPTPGVLLPGTLASPRAGLAPAGCRELVARLRRGALLSVMLGARATGRTFRRNRAGCSQVDRQPVIEGAVTRQLACPSWRRLARLARRTDQLVVHRRSVWPVVLFG